MVINDENTKQTALCITLHFLEEQKQW